MKKLVLLSLAICLTVWPQEAKNKGEGHSSSQFSLKNDAVHHSYPACRIAVSSTFVRLKSRLKIDSIFAFFARCQPWQYKADDGECRDKPGTRHYRGENHEPGPGEECWLECLCREDEYPTGSSCSPCSYAGTVCITS